VTETRRLRWTLLASLLALTLALGLTFLLSHFQVQAQSATEAAEADLEARKEVSSDEAEPGDVLTYTITVSNSGDSPAVTWLTDTLPDGLTYRDNTLTATRGTSDIGAGIITWTAELSPNDSAMVTFGAEVSSGVSRDSWITNTVEISGPSQSFTRSVGVYVTPDVYYVHFPIIAKRWPPVPYAPTLNEIVNADEDQSYRVSWSYDASYPADTRPDSYILQEAEDANFTQDVRNYDPALDPDCDFSPSGGYCDVDNDSGTYYYRVAGENQNGMGSWSNVEEAYVWSYDDDFSDYKSGWPRLWERTRGALYQVRPYEHPDCGSSKDCKYEDGDGYIVARRAEQNPRAQFTPDVEVPSTNYQLEVDSRWFEASYRATYEIFFSAEDDFDSYYAVKVRIEDPQVTPLECRYRVYKHENGKDEDFHSDGWRESDSIHCGVVLCDEDGDSCGTTRWNEWKIEREGDWISVEVNGDLLGKWRDRDPFGSDRVFGLGATNYEGFTPSKPVFDNFEVELED